MRRSLLFIGAALLLCAQMFASVVQVGNCKPRLPRYTTIQQAVNSVPANSTIDVCPGTYPEQVTIPNALTLIGVSATNQGAAVITAPAGGMQGSSVMDAYTNVPVAAQILVDASGASVTINNITVDGSNNGITSCTPELVGIFYQNSFGTVTHSNVLNENTPAANGCQSGQGIYVQSSGGSSNVSITNNHVENYQKNGIVARQPGSIATISANTVVGQGVTSGAAENSIEIAFGATGTVTSNTVGSDEYSDPNVGTGAGILVYQAAHVTVTKNTVSDTQTGIGVYPVSGNDSDFASITNNLVSATHVFDGIDVCSSNNTITGNTVNGSDEAGVHLDSACTGASTNNVVNNNTINGACAGFLVGTGSGSVGTGNKYYSAATLVMSNSDTCTPPLWPQKPAKGHAGSKLVKP